MKKKFLTVILSLIFSLSALAGCGNNSGADFDILTQKPVSEDKINVTVLVKYAFGINTFEIEAEKKFPNLNIIQVGNFTSDMGIEEYKARLIHDDLTDIVMTWPLEVGSEYWDDRLLDLSTFSVTSRYTTKSLNQISYGEDGKLYYLPGPSQVRGIVYNKTMFKEKGWAVPENFEGFIKLCKSIEESGMRSLQLGLANSEVLDTAFTGFGFESCYANPESAKKIEDYNNGKGSFKDNFMPALETFERLINEGILKENDLNISYAKRENMLFKRECAMVEDSVLMARMGEDQTGTTDEFALMPFFNPGSGGNDWARLYNVCFIGLNKHLADKGNEKKFEVVKKLIDYISTEDGQKALAGDTGAMFSSLKGVLPPAVEEIVDLQTALNAGRYGVFPTLKNAQEALRSGLAGMISGKQTKEDLIKAVDYRNKNPSITSPALSIGAATENFTMVETGNFVADALREKANADFALFLDNGKDGLFNGKGISGKIYKGDITLLDIKRILPDLKHDEKGVMQKITMTGENLIKTLEYSIPVDNEKNGWFYYFSGLKMQYDPSLAPGSRIKKITDLSGNAIDKSKVYSVAVMDCTVKNEYILSLEDSNVKIDAILQSKIIKEKNISPSKDNRFKI